MRKMFNEPFGLLLFELFGTMNDLHPLQPNIRAVKMTPLVQHKPIPKAEKKVAYP